jgi:hypothetical protein
LLKWERFAAIARRDKLTSAPAIAAIRKTKVDILKADKEPPRIPLVADCTTEDKGSTLG